MPLREDSIRTDSKYEDGDEYEYEEGGFDGGSHENEDDDGNHHAADDISFSDTKSDQVLSSQVVATLSDLGHYNRMTNTYQLNHRDAGSCLKDFIRFLRNDGLNFLVRRQMGISNIVSNDLLPIVEQHTVNAQSGAITDVSKSIMDKVIRLLVDLTNPTMLHYKNQQAPKEDKHEVQIYMELQSMLYQYKCAFALHKRFWIVLSKHLTRILELEEEERQVEDGLMFERIIVLIRNVLHIPLMDTATTEDINAHDRVIEQMHHAGILDILQYMISADEYKDYCFHLAEILYLLFREQSAEFLAKSVEGDPLASAHLDKETRDQLLASSGRSSFEVECDRREMDEVRLRDRQINAVIAAKFDAKSASNRYARPTYVVKNMKSISDRDIICHQPYMNPEVEIDLNRNKSAKMRARNRRPMAENMDNSDALGVQRIHRSSRKLRLILHEFCQKFLADCYNGFMGTVKANLSRGAAQDHDETYYVWAMQFFMEFNRHRPKATAEERYRQVYETMATSTFHYLQTLVDDYLDHLAQKKLFKLEMSDWSKRLHCALRSYRELLFSLSTLSGLDLVEAQKMCHRIKQDIFTEPDYREMLLRLLQAYNEERMSKAYLRDLIETNHVFLKMLDYHAKISFDFKVKFKKRKRKAPKKAKKSDEPEPEPEEEPVNPDELWTELIDEVSNVLQSKTLSEESVIGEHEELRELFDPLTDATLDDQKLGAMRKVCQLLRKKEVESAIRLFREARHALAGLDDENAFGEIGIAPEDELLALNEVMMVEFPEEEKKKKVEEENDEEVDEEEEEEEAFRSSSMHEAAFSLEDTVRRYAHPNVLRAYRLMLRNYKSNSIMTNHSIVRMLYRIAVDLKMVPMFYNFGYFFIFESILADPLYAPARAPTKKPSSSLESVVEELGQFARFVTRKFFKLLEKYPNIPCELCFAANSRDSYAMEMGFDEQQVAALLKEKKKKILWTDEQELELEVLVKECRDKVVANNKEKDLVDLVQEKLMDESKTRRQILKKLKEMGLLQESDLKTKTSWKGPAWTVEELVELRQLYQKFKDVQDFSEFAPSLPIVQEDSADKPPPLTTMIEESFSVEPPQEVPVDEGQDEKVSEEGPKDVENVDETPKEPPTDDVPVQDDDDEASSDKNNQNKKVQPKPKRADIIDAILQSLTTRDKRNRRQVMRQLKSMNIYDHSGGKKWTPEHLEELRTVFCNLFIDYKEYRDKEEEETFQNEEEESTRNDEEESSQNEEKVADKEKSSDMKKKRKVLIDDDDSGMEEEEESSKKNQENLEESSQKEGEESSRMEVGEESSGKNEDSDPQDEQSIDKESMKKKKRAVLFDSDDEEEDESSKNKEGGEESSRKDEEEESSRKNEDKKQESSREDFNFSLKFQSKFSDKSKSWSQILRQLKKMGFDESLKTMGLIKAGGKGGRGNDEKKSTFVGNEFVDSSGSSDEEDEIERPEVDDDKDDDSSDDEGQRFKSSRPSRTTKNYSMFEREDVVVQYDSEDEDSRKVSTTIKASRTSMELAAILEDIPDVVEDASQPEDHVIKSSEVKSSVTKSSVSLQVDESESAQKKKAKLSENKKKLERLRQFMINNDNGEDESDDEESSPKEEISRKKEEKVVDKKKSSSSDKQAQKKKKRKVLIDEDDSDKEEEEESSQKDEDSDSSAQDESIDKKKSMKKKKRAVLIDSDNEEEEERSRKDEENLSDKEVDDEDSLDKNQNPRSNKRKLMDSDDEEEEESSRKNEDKDDSMVMQVDDDDKEEEESSYQSKNKKKRVILDDDDE